MSGHTGKMTREAIAVRGPRMVLYKLHNPTREHSMYVIGRYGQSPFTDRRAVILRWNFWQVARSYTLSYLIGIAHVTSANTGTAPQPIDAANFEK